LRADVVRREVAFGMVKRGAEFPLDQRVMNLLKNPCPAELRVVSTGISYASWTVASTSVASMTGSAKRVANKQAVTTIMSLTP
jgi:hypothetical protein